MEEQMDVDAEEVLTDLKTLSAEEPTSTLPRLRELADAAEHAMASGRYSKAGLAATLTHQAIHYLIEGVEREQYGTPEIKRRFSIAIRRAEAWAKEQSPAFRPADEP
jgi:hypothetical protein